MKGASINAKKALDTPQKRAATRANGCDCASPKLIPFVPSRPIFSGAVSRDVRKKTTPRSRE